MRLPGIYVSQAPPSSSFGDGSTHLGSGSSTVSSVRAKTPTRSEAVIQGRHDEPRRTEIHASVERFNDVERRHLLLATRVGPKFVRQLELAGFSSIDEIRAVGVQEVLARIAVVLGVPARANRRQALARAISTAPHGLRS